MSTLHATTRAFDVEIVIVDHASERQDTAGTLRRLVRDHPVRIVRAEGEFNFARLLNAGRAAARGDILFSVNDDIEACNEGWLEPLARLLALPDTGCVGPCLLYPDRRIQHAGVVAGIGGMPDHVGKFRHWGDPGLPAILTHVRQVAAVTGAVLGARARNWDAAGGWREDFAVEYNDIDFCFQMAKRGLRNIYCPDSVLIHHESASRGAPAASSQWARIQADRNRFVAENWRNLMHDPWYPANYALSGVNLDLADPPRRPPLAEMPDFAAD